MEFSDFLKFCNTYLYNNKTLEDFMYEFFSMITSDDDMKADDSSPFEADGFDAKARKIYYGDRLLSKNDAKFVKSHFNENALLLFIEGKLKAMKEHIQINFENDLKEFCPEKELYGGIEACFCQVFLRYIDEIINQKRAPRKSNALENVLNNNVSEESDINNLGTESDLSFDEQTLTLARNFCIDHEEERELIPLCQIGYYINPLHKHNREMYTEYNRLSVNVRKAIMFLNDIPFYEFEEEWEYRYLELFREDIKRIGLIKEDKDLLYEGGKYFHRAARYADIVLSESNPRIFPAVPHPILFNRDKSDLINYIDEYLYYQGNEEAIKHVAEPPFEWMRNNLGLLDCPENQLTYYMCLFIYSACHVIPREYGRKDPEEISFTTPNLEYIETMEDFYFAALMALYNIYY